MLTKEGLLDFFQQRSQSPLGRSASARRHRHTIPSTADRELQGYLELFGRSGNPGDYSKYNSLPRAGRAAQRRTAPWISGQDDNRELGCDRRAASPRADAEAVSPLARFSSSGLNDNEPHNNNNGNYPPASEGGALPRPFCVSQKSSQLPSPPASGHMSVSVEAHTLVRGPRAFDLPSPNNNSHPVHFVNRGDVVVTDLEKGRQPLPVHSDILLHHHVSEREAGPKVAWGGQMDPPTPAGVSPEREEEDNSTVSSTTCDTPLPLDPSGSSQKPAVYIPDCTETDCSVTSDYSEVDSSSVTKEGLYVRPIGCGTSDQEGKREPSPPSSNLESVSPDDRSNELSAPDSADAASSAAPSAATEGWDTESCDTAEGKQGAEKDAQAKSRADNKAPKSGGGRTLTSSESQGMRKVAPITELTGGGKARPLRDQSTPARGRSERTARPPRHSSLPPEESEDQGGGLAAGGASRWERDSTPRKFSVGRPSARPPRSVPKPEEKMCRSTMRALAQALAQGGASSENSSCHALGAKSGADVPGFARNTVASTSRTKKELADPSDPSVPSLPSTPSRSPSLPARQSPAKQSRSAPAAHAGEERPPGTSLRRVQSVKANSRSAYRSGTPPPPAARDDVRKASSISEKSVHSRDPAAASRGAKPSWK